MADATSSNSEELDQTATGQADTAAETTDEQSTGTDTTSTADTAQDSTTEHTSTGEEEDEQFFDPKAVPAELQPAYKQMQRAFVQKTQALASKRKELEQAGATKQEAVEQTAPQADDIEAEVLQELGVNPAQLDNNTRQLLNVMIAVSKRVAGRQVNTAVAPIYADKTLQEVNSYFAHNPDAENYRKEMAAIDRRTGEKLTLPELYQLASAKDRTASQKKDQADRAQQRRLNNIESTGSTATTVAKPSGSPFDSMLDESRKKRLP